MPAIKKSNITESMMNKSPIITRDIGAGAKILVLSRCRNGSVMTCLERDGVRTNFAMSNIFMMSGHNYICKSDGVNEWGNPFCRYVNVDSLCRLVNHKRVRNATEVIYDANNE